MSTIIEKLDIIDREKLNMKTAIQGKGAIVTDSLASFAPAIESIQTGGKIEPKKTLDVVTSGNYKINAGVGFDGIEGATINVNVPSSPMDPSDLELFKMIGWDKVYGYSPLNPNETPEDYLTRLRNDIIQGKTKYDNWNPTTTIADKYFELEDTIIYAPKIDTQNVTSMNFMFRNCKHLQILPELDTSKVTSMEGMFRNCYALKVVPEINLTNVQSCKNMFLDCTNLTEVRFKGGHYGILCTGMFNRVSPTGIVYFKDDGSDYRDIIKAIPPLWTYKFY